MSFKVTKAASGCAPSEESPSGQAVSNSIDLLTKILLLLPAKSLIRFNCVCKHWRSLISDTEFSTHHSRLNAATSIKGLYFTARNPSHRLVAVSLLSHRNLPPLSFLDALEGKYFPTTIQHSCNGLQLLTTQYVACDGHRLPELLYIVCNPTTNKYAILPKTGSPSQLRSPCAYLSFDPSKSPLYKVVVDLCIGVDVYHSQTRNWKRIYFLRNSLYKLGRGAFWNGAIYWLCYSSGLVKFDVDAAKMIHLPHLHRPSMISHSTRYIGECGGSLILILSHSLTRMQFEIIELESESSHWIVKHRVNLTGIVSALSLKEKVLKYFVLCVVESKTKEGKELVLAIAGKVISYNLKSERLDVLRDLVSGEFIDHGVYGFSPFVESLAPICPEIDKV